MSARQVDRIYNDVSGPHFEFRGGRWWECVQASCDQRHHYYVAAAGYFG